jgi:hypothetical protein
MAKMQYNHISSCGQCLYAPGHFTCTVRHKHPSGFPGLSNVLPGKQHMVAFMGILCQSPSEQHSVGIYVQLYCVGPEFSPISFAV